VASGRSVIDEISIWSHGVEKARWRSGGAHVCRHAGNPFLV